MSKQTYLQDRDVRILEFLIRIRPRILTKYPHPQQ